MHNAGYIVAGLSRFFLIRDDFEVSLHGLLITALHLMFALRRLVCIFAFQEFPIKV